MLCAKRLAIVLVVTGASCRLPPDGAEDPSGRSDSEATAEPREPAAPLAAETIDPLDARLEQIYGRLEAGEVDEAAEQLAALRAQSDDAVTLARIDVMGIRVLVARGEVEAALNLAVQTIEQLERHRAPARALAHAHQSLGHAFFAHLEVPLALQAWREAERYCEGDDPATRLLRGRIRFNQAMALELQGQIDQSLSVATAGLEDEAAGGAIPCPDLAVSRVHLAGKLAKAGRFSDADRMFDEAEQNCAGVENAQLILADVGTARARALSEQGRTEEALAAVQAARAGLTSDHVLATFAEVRAVLAESYILRHADRAAEAEALLAQTVPRFHETLGPKDSRLLSLCIEQFDVLLVQGRRPTAARVSQCRDVAEQLGHHRGTEPRYILEQLIEQLEDPHTDRRRVDH